MSVDGSPNLVYPAPRLPMVGKYLVRKRYVATGLRAIDLACSAFGRQASTAAPDQGEKIRSIVFAQCGHFGDLIMTLPTLHWVRQNRPEMRIGLIVGSWARPMMGGISALFDASYFADHFMLNRSSRPLKEKLAQHRQSWKMAAAQIRRDGYDSAVDCYPFVQNSIPLLYASGIPVRAGFTSGGFGPLLTLKSQWEPAFFRSLARQSFSGLLSTATADIRASEAALRRLSDRCRKSDPRMARRSLDSVGQGTDDAGQFGRVGRRGTKGEGEGRPHRRGFAAVGSCRSLRPIILG